MNKQVILRPVFDRPEMLQLSIEYEIKAREYYILPGKFYTLFAVEHGAPQKIFDLINEYPFEHGVIIRGQKFGLTKNILEGMKSAFEITNDFVIYIEDDILIHETYFKYMNILLNMENLGPYTVLSAYNKDNNGDIHEVYKGHHYCAWGALMSKKFFMDYVIHCINSNYYENYASRDKFVRALGEKFKDNKLYKYKNNPGMHNEQAGLINRLTDIAVIQDNAYVILPRVNRQMHIGLVGKNRPGRLPGNTYEECLINLRDIIKNNRFYEVTQAKMYNDYLIFDSRLDEWDGILYVR